MAVNDTAYCTVQQVKLRVQDVAEYSDAQVESAINDSASYMHMRMADADYQVPTAADIRGPAPLLADMLQAINANGAVVWLLTDTSGEAVFLDEGTQLPTRSQRYFNLWRQGLTWLKGSGPEAQGMERRTSRSGSVRVGSAIDRETGALKDGRFRRGQFDFLGAPR